MSDLADVLSYTNDICDARETRPKGVFSRQNKQRRPVAADRSHLGLRPREPRSSRRSAGGRLGEYAASLRVVFDGVLDADLEADREAFDESLFFRVMTQVDWLWNYMKIEKD